MSASKIILSSGSPRRQELLKEAGVDYMLKVIETDESFPSSLDVSKVAEYIAVAKAEAHESTLAVDEIVITADTVVAMNDQIYGKPKSKDEAIEMLLTFSDDEHQVYTGVCIKSQSKTVSFTCKSDVTFASITKEEAEYYFDKDNPMDKAGSYGIQDWIGKCKVIKINGSYTNIMGLPIPQVIANLNRFNTL